MSEQSHKSLLKEGSTEEEEPTTPHPAPAPAVNMNNPPRVSSSRYHQLRDELEALKRAQINLEEAKDNYKNAHNDSGQEGEEQMQEIVPGEEKSFLDLSRYPFLRESLEHGGRAWSSDKSVEEVLELIGSSKMKELDDKWKMLWDEQMQLSLKQNELVLEQGRLITDASEEQMQEIVPGEEKSFLDLSRCSFLRESLKHGVRAWGSDNSVEEVLGVIGSSKMKELDDKWKMLWDEQMQLSLKQNELILEQSKLITDASTNVEKEKEGEDDDESEEVENADHSLADQVKAHIMHAERTLAQLTEERAKWMQRFEAKLAEKLQPDDNLM